MFIPWSGKSYGTYRDGAIAINTDVHWVLEKRSIEYILTKLLHEIFHATERMLSPEENHLTSDALIEWYTNLTSNQIEMLRTKYRDRSISEYVARQRQNLPNQKLGCY